MPDRRGFFKDMLREMLSARESLNEALGSFNEPEPDPWRAPPPSPAAPAMGFVDDERLLELARETGLEQRLDDVRRTARASVRLTPAATLGRSQLGGSPLLPPGFEWPTWFDRELAFVAQVDLAELHGVGASGPLPEDGLLLVFAELAAVLTGLSPQHAGSSRVVLVPPETELVEDTRRTPHIRELSVELSRELQLPSAWSHLAEPLALDLEESDAWEELRSLLARAQSIELEDEGLGRMALHRLLGYQDEVGRELEFDCQLASAGHDAGDVVVYYEQRDAHEAEARHWRLLLQVTAEPHIPLGDGMERFFVCIRDDDLQALRLDRAWALLR